KVECEAIQADSAAEPALPGGLPAALHGWARRRQYVLDSIDHELRDLRDKIAQRQQELSELNTQTSALRPLGDAKQQKRWWTGAWWRATFREDIAAQVAELEKREEQARTGLARLEEEAHALGTQREEAVADGQAERARLLAAEVGRLEAELDDQ